MVLKVLESDVDENILLTDSVASSQLDNEVPIVEYPITDASAKKARNDADSEISVIYEKVTKPEMIEAEIMLVKSETEFITFFTYLSNPALEVRYCFIFEFFDLFLYILF